MPTQRPIVGLPSAVLTTPQFQAVFRSGRFVGATLVVRGRLDANLLPCTAEGTCANSMLAGATIGGGAFPLPVRARHTELPVAGELVLRIASAESVEYLGRAMVDWFGDIWPPIYVDGLDKTALEPGQVVLVYGWLSQSTIRVDCPPLEPPSQSPRHFCGHQAWISTSAHVGQGEQVLGVQHDAYRKFAPDPRLDSLADAYLPRQGLMAVGVRLELDGCLASPCTAWHVLAWITMPPTLTVPALTP